MTFSSFVTGVAGVVVTLVIVAGVGLVVLNRTRGVVSVGSPRLAEGILAEPPNSPNCVSTQADPGDDTHRVEPIAREISVEEVAARVEGFVAIQPRMRIIERAPTYLRLTERSELFRFVDDIDLFFSPDQEVIHFRSASRVGYGDMGVNRERYRRFQELFRAEVISGINGSGEKDR